MSLRGTVKRIRPGQLCLIVALLMSSPALATYQGHFITEQANIPLPINYRESQHNLANAQYLSAVNDTSRREPSKGLTQQQRKQIKQRRKQFEALPPEEKNRIRKARQHFRELPTERKQELRRKWENLPPEERNRKRSKSRDEQGNNRYRALRA